MPVFLNQLREVVAQGHLAQFDETGVVHKQVADLGQGAVVVLRIHGHGIGFAGSLVDALGNDLAVAAFERGLVQAAA